MDTTLMPVISWTIASMPAYALVLVEVTDWERFSEYTQATPAVVAQFGGKFFVRGGKTATLEGPEEERRVVVIEFPSFERAEAFCHSEEYQQARKLRTGTAIGTFILADGCVPTS
jgi:uncharacterized protein (DUF1330 family)